MRPAPGASSSWSLPSQSPAAPPPATSPWHTPVPYLFGGLAAMLGLIALSLLILACSYVKLDSCLGSGDDADDAAGGAADGDGSKSPAAAASASSAAVPGLVAVVMAGEKTPTFLAAPVVRGPAPAVGVPAGEGSTEAEEGEEDGGGKAAGGESGVHADDAEGGGRRQTGHA